MSKAKQLSAKRREVAGKGAARAIRREGRVPAVIYGAGEAPSSISLDYAVANRLIYAGHFLTTIFEIDVEGKKERAIPRDYQLDPVKDTPVHIDFLRLGKDSTVRVEIPVHFINHEASPGLKRGGALNIVRHAVEMVVLADNIPENLTADLTGLDLNDSVHISAIKLPAGSKPTITDRDFTIATIAAPSGFSEAEEAPAEAAAAPAAGKAAAPAAKPADKK